MPRKHYIRKKRGSPWNSESSRRANAARWARDRARRDTEEPERVLQLAEIDAVNLPRCQGDPIGLLQWTDFRTGKIRRWTIRIGKRRDQITIHAPDGRSSGHHGWTWVLNHLRGYLAGTKR